MAYTSVLIPESDKHLWTAAAGDLGISQSEFLREALREKARKVLRRQKPCAEATTGMQAM